MLGGRIFSCHQVFATDSVPRNCRRFDRKGLGGRIPFTRGITLGDRPFLDAEDGGAVLTIQNKHVGMLANLSERRDRLPVSSDVEQAGRRGKVVVPQFVVNVLKIPLQLAG